MGWFSDPPPAPAPDPLIGEAAKMNAELGKRAMDISEARYAEERPMRDALSQRALDVADAQLATSRQQSQIADEERAYLTNTFRPLERSLVAEAIDYDTSARRDTMANEAIAGVNSQFAGAQQGINDAAGARGVDVSSPAVMAELRKLMVAQGAAGALAGNQARRNVEQQGYARRMDAASLGRNLPSQQATAAQIATNAGSTSVGTAGVPLSVSQQATQGLMQGIGTNMQGNSSAAGIMNQVYNGQLSAWDSINRANSAQTAAFGQALGMAGGAYLARLPVKAGS
jgi:hypothetical protein